MVEAKMDENLINFFTRRAKLLSEQDAARAQIDAWLATHFNSETELKDLAFLEGLLSERKALLTQLVELDERVINDLVRIRGAASTRAAT
jgi:hypothetical protein